MFGLVGVVLFIMAIGAFIQHDGDGPGRLPGLGSHHVGRRRLPDRSAVAPAHRAAAQHRPSRVTGRDRSRRRGAAVTPAPGAHRPAVAHADHDGRRGFGGPSAAALGCNMAIDRSVPPAGDLVRRGRAGVAARPPSTDRVSGRASGLSGGSACTASSISGSIRHSRSRGRSGASAARRTRVVAAVVRPSRD